MHGFPELVIGGVLVAPFVLYAAAAFALLMLLRPVLRLVRFERVVSNPPLAMMSLYVVLLALLIASF